MNDSRNFRDTAHGQEKEPFLERFLSASRYAKTIRFLRKNCKDRQFVGLDAGCGYHGAFVAKVNAALPAIHFHGCDICVAPEQSDLFVCNIDDLATVTLKPDIVVMHAVLEHLDNPSNVLSAVHALLPMGGYLIVTVPSPRAKRILEILAFQLGIVSKKEIEDHKHYWNKKTFLAMLDRSNQGFSVAAHRYFQFRLNNWIVLQKTRP
jgi:2-polyprenyl-3-methyl-5-hydroxy-6-metoxy-1,4-benzoquinol methylase